MASKLEKEAEFRIMCAGIPKPVAEYQFCPGRRWRFDFAWVEQKIALECEGGIWLGGAHTRGKHFLSDCEKYNTAVKQGWRVLRYANGNMHQMTEDLKELLNAVDKHKTI